MVRVRRRSYGGARGGWLVNFVGTVQGYERRTDTHLIAFASGYGATPSDCFPLGKQGNDPAVPPMEACVQVALHKRLYCVLAKRGPMRILLYYDLACFLAIAALKVTIFYQSSFRVDLEQGWQIRAAATCA